MLLKIREYSLLFARWRRSPVRTGAWSVMDTRDSLVRAAPLLLDKDTVPERLGNGADVMRELNIAQNKRASTSRWLVLVFRV